MRYLDEFQNISEVFIGLLNLERITGEHIGEAILKSYRELGLDVKKCKGQCYDGAANMQSKKKGVASVILREGPNSIVTHCFSHNLNLSLAASCDLAIIVWEDEKCWLVCAKLAALNETCHTSIPTCLCHSS